jgi:hypothetical protein
VQDSPEEQNSEVVDQGQVTETDNPIPQESLTPRRPIFKKPICKKSRPTGNDEKSRADEAYAILKSSTKRDDFSIYGEHVGNELRKLQPTAQIYVKHAINNILFQAALGRYDRPNYSEQLNFSSTLVYTSTPSPSPSSTESHISPEAATANELSEYLNFD